MATANSLTIVQQIRQIRQRIKRACAQANRNVDDVKLLLATKTVPAEQIAAALHTGETLIGENKVQEVKLKYEALKHIPHEKHFIGHLQSNKINDILKHGVTCIQSLDNLSLATKLEQRLAILNRKMEVFVQVNTSGEESKFGIQPEAALQLVKDIAALPHLRIKGLMTIGLFNTEAEKVRPSLRLLKTIQQEIEATGINNVSVAELSMGMSTDLEIAIEEGATIVRVGSAIFGKRIYPDSYYWNENI